MTNNHLWRTVGMNLLAAVLACATFGGTAARAADPAFVGVLAMAVDKDVAQQLGLSDAAKKKLQDLINSREDEAIELALSIKDLPAAEQVAKLAPFVAESERLGMELLTVVQRSKLQQILVAREGLAALAEPGLAESLGLSDEQKAQIEKIIVQRTVDMTKGGESERRITQSVYERQLDAVLTDQQRTTWRRMAGLPAGASPAADKPTEAVAAVQPTAEPPQDEPAVTKPAVTKPATSEKPAAAEKPVSTEKPASTMISSAKPAATEIAADSEAPPEPIEPNESSKPGTFDPTDENSRDPRSPAPRGFGKDDRGGRPERSLPPLEPGKLRFNFVAAPWQEVLDWFAEQADVSLALDATPAGTFTYRDQKAYSVDEAIDLLNSYLLTKGYTLVRRERILLVIDLENPVPEELVTLVTIDELDKRGRFELVKCLFPLARMKAEDAKEMIEEYLGPQGSVIAFPKARQILVTETAGKLRTIRDMVERVEDPQGGGIESVVEINLKYASAEEVLAIARPLLGLDEGKNSGEDISISIDLLGTRLFATGSPDKLQILQEVVPKIDKAPAAGTEGAKEPEPLTLKSYYIKAADTQLVLKVLQTLLANLPGVRLDVDETSKKIIALAHTSEHKTIEDTIAQLEGQTKAFEVIQLRKVDPQLVVAAVTKFFNLSAGGENAAVDPEAPIVDGDATSMQLWVRGSQAQIDQIKELVAKLEGPEAEGTARAHVRLLPLAGPEATKAVETIQKFWDRKNPIRIVTPSALTPTGIKQRTVAPPPTETQAETPAEATSEPAENPFEAPAVDERRVPAPPARPAIERPDAAGVGKAAARQPAARFQLVGQISAQPSNDDDGPAPPRSAPPRTAPAGGASNAEIRIAVTANGLMIASDDLDALDEFEDMLRAIAGPASLNPPREITVFYLKYSKAEVASQLIQQILGGQASDAVGGSSLLGDMTSSLLGGGLIGGLLGGMAGSGGGGEATGATTIEASGVVSIVPDPRLNALIVQANATDLELIEQILQVIDKEDSITQIQTAGTPRLIPVKYGNAADIANVVREVFADRVSAGSRANQQRQPSPEEFIRALRGQRGGNEQNGGEEQKMTVGVDTRSNALIVTGPEQLFKQVEALVLLIDQPGSSESDVVSIVPIKVTDPSVVQKTLNSILKSTQTASSSSSSSSGSSGRDSSPAPDAAMADQIRQRMEMFQRMQSGGGGGGPPSGFGGAPSGGGPPGGFGSGGRGGGRGR